MKIFSWLGKHISDVNVKAEPEGMNLPPTHQEWRPEVDVMLLKDPRGNYLYAKEILAGTLTVNHARRLAGYTAIDEDKPLQDIQTVLDNETAGDIFETLSSKQKNVVYALIGQALETDRERKDDG